MDNELQHAIRRLTAWNVGDDDICPDYTPDAAEFQVDVATLLEAAKVTAARTKKVADSKARHAIPLLPCPFCDGTSVDADSFGAGAFCVTCKTEECMVIGPEAPTREEAAAKWNAAPRPAP